MDRLTEELMKSEPWASTEERAEWWRNKCYEIFEQLEHYRYLEEAGRLIELKYGTWESLDSYVYECDGMWQCSECGEDFYFEFGTPLECRAYYCPNCGAKMKLKELEGVKE